MILAGYRNKLNFVKHLRINKQTYYFCSLFCHFKLYTSSQFLVLSLSLDNGDVETVCY